MCSSISSPHASPVCCKLMLQKVFPKTFTKITKSKKENFSTTLLDVSKEKVGMLVPSSWGQILNAFAWSRSLRNDTTQWQCKVGHIFLARKTSRERKGNLFSPCWVLIVPSRVSTEGDDGGWTMNARADVSTRNPSPGREERERFWSMISKGIKDWRHTQCHSWHNKINQSEKDSHDISKRVSLFLLQPFAIRLQLTSSSNQPFHPSALHLFRFFYQHHRSQCWQLPASQSAAPSSWCSPSPSCTPSSKKL